MSFKVYRGGFENDTKDAYLPLLPFVVLWPSLLYLMNVSLTLMQTGLFHYPAHCTFPTKSLLITIPQYVEKIFYEIENTLNGTFAG